MHFSRHVRFALSMAMGLLPLTAALSPALPLPPSSLLRVSGAGLRRRQNTSSVKGRVAKGRFAGTAGKIRP